MSSTAGSVPGDGIARPQASSPARPLDEAPERHVLAERDPRTLSYRSHHACRRGRRRSPALRKCSSLIALRDARRSAWCPAPGPGRSSAFSSFSVSRPSTATTFSGHSTRSTGGSTSLARRLEVALEHLAVVGVLGPGVLRAAALHERTPQRVDLVAPSARRARAVSTTTTTSRRPRPPASSARSKPPTGRRRRRRRGTTTRCEPAARRSAQRCAAWLMARVEGDAAERPGPARHSASRNRPGSASHRARPGGHGRDRRRRSRPRSTLRPGRSRAR